MKHAYILTDVASTPHGPLMAEKQSGTPSIPIQAMLGHFDGFDLFNFFAWEKRHLADKFEKKFITYFIHMPEPIEFHFGKDVVQQINNDQNTYLLLFSMLEGVITVDDLAAKLAAKGISPHKTIVFCSNRPVHGTKQKDILFLYIDFWESYTRYHQHTVKGSTELSIQEREKTVDVAKKKFLCLNRNIKSHRIWFYWLMQRKKLIDESHVSFHLPKISRGEWVWLSDDYMTKKWIPKHLQQEYQFALKRQLLPRVLDKLDNQFIIQYNNSVKPFYEDSLFSIVTESDFRLPFLTEKTYKAIVHCHPFFVIGSPDHHRILRDNGYHTFEDFFGVDQVTNWEEASVMLDIIKRTDIKTYRKKVKELLPKLEHNYNNFFNRRISWNDIEMTLDMATL